MIFVVIRVKICIKRDTNMCDEIHIDLMTMNFDIFQLGIFSL